MFNKECHENLFKSLETIGAAFAIYETIRGSSGNFVLVSGNTLYEELTGKEIHNCVNKTIREILPRYVAMPLSEGMTQCLSQQAPQETEIVVEHASTSRWWRVVCTPVLPSIDNMERVINTCIEITEKKRLERELDITRERFEAVVETAYDGIISIDERQTIKLINESARSIFGVHDEKVVGTSLERFIPQRFRAKHAGYVTAFKESSVKARQMQSRASVIGLRADGSEFPVEVTISKIRVGAEMEMTAVIRDISERNRLIEELSKAATHDALTGIFNRRHLTTLLTRENDRCKRYKHPVGFLLFDVDHFKEINDTLGHLCGDAVLKAIAGAVSDVLRNTDSFCRWGGEEFVILLPESDLSGALAYAERLRKIIESTPIEGCREPVRITASFGVTITSGQDENIDTIIERADNALYEAKEKGRNCVVGKGEETP